MSASARKHCVALFYLFAFILSWSFWGAMAGVFRSGSPLLLLTIVFSTLGALGPLASLGLLEKLTGKQVRVNAILGTIRLRGADKRALLAAALALPALTLLGNLAAHAAAPQEPLRWIKPGPDRLGILVLPVMMLHFGTALFTSPLFEEPGWRGFALVELQRRFGRHAGSLVVGTLWWVWHQPMNVTFGIAPSVYGFLSMLSYSFVIDSLFNLSGRNLLTAMLAHQSAGTVILFLHQGRHNPFTLGLQMGLALALRCLERKRHGFAHAPGPGLARGEPGGGA